MSKLLLSAAIILTVVLNNATGMDHDNSDPKNILILFSYTPTTPAYRIILDGIRQKLDDEFGDTYNLHMEYLETERYPRGKYPKEKVDLYNRKYADVELDLLICVGIDIITTLNQFVDDHLKSIPSLTIDFDLSKYEIIFDLSLNRQTAKIGLEMDAGKTIAEALNIFPQTSSVHFICGISRADSLYMKISMAEAEKMDKKIKISFITNRSMDEVISMVRKLADNSLIFVAGFNTDKNHVPYYNPEAVRLISRSANAPVFTYSDMGFGEGAFGGRVMSFKKIGLLGGKAAVSILNGADPLSIKIRQEEYYDYLLDYRELKRWGLTGLEKKKSGYTVLYREERFFGKYKWFLMAGILFLFLQSFLIAALVRMNRKQKSLTMQMVESDRHYRDIIMEDRILRMGLLSASLSHELNQPLTAILSTAQAGLRFIESGTTDQILFKELFNNIAEDNKRAASTLKSIRGLMKLEKRDKERVDLNNLIAEISELYHSKAIELNSKLYLQLPDIHVYILADSIQIQQVILNFISNASQAMEKTRKNANVIFISETPEDGFVKVSVRDFGKGIPEDMRERLFEPFVTSRKDGTGVGLAVSKLIIEDHQGKIWWENKPDRGAEFSFSLKIYDGQLS